MNGATRSRAISQPLTAPSSHPGQRARSPRRARCGKRPRLPIGRRTRPRAEQARRRPCPQSPAMEPTDRSMPPLRIDERHADREDRVDRDVLDQNRRGCRSSGTRARAPKRRSTSTTSAMKARRRMSDVREALAHAGGLTGACIRSTGLVEASPTPPPRARHRSRPPPRLRGDPAARHHEDPRRRGPHLVQLRGREHDAQASAARRRIDSRISALAPTSTPRVGSSISSTRGRLIERPCRSRPSAGCRRSASPSARRRPGA